MSRNFELLQRLEQERSTDIRSDNVGSRVKNPDGPTAAAHAAVAPVRKPNLAPHTYEELNKLVQRLFLADEVMPRMIAFTGSGPGVGCTWIAARTAEVLSCQTERTVCLVETVSTGTGVREHFSIAAGAGFAQALMDGGPVRNYTRRAANLWVLPGGKPAAEEVAVPRERVESLLLELRKEFDFILLDTAPIGADSLMLARLSDAVVLVLKAGHTKRDAGRLAIEQLERAAVKVVGTVLNQREYPIPAFLYRRL
jgi:polysaccharide biosynthesis transport protein